MIEFFKAEWRVIVGAPVTFLAVIGLAGYGSHWLTSRIYDRQIATFETIIDQKDDLIGQQRGLITEIREQMQDLRHDMEERFRDVDRRLSEQQAAVVEEDLKRHPSEITLRAGERTDTKALQELAEIFERSGWQVTTTFSDLASDDIQIQTESEEDALAIEEAFGSVGARDFFGSVATYSEWEDATPEHFEPEKNLEHPTAPIPRSGTEKPANTLQRE